MTGSIICGVDDSESAKGAARVARGLSSKLGLRLVFVRVVEPGSAEEQISAIAERLERLTGCTTEVDCGAGWLVDVGHPADRLVAVAADEKARLIVVGSTGPRSSLLGSVSAEVSRRAPCPVVVVPPGADGHGGSDFVDAIARLGHDSNRTRARASDDPDMSATSLAELSASASAGTATATRSAACPARSRAERDEGRADAVNDGNDRSDRSRPKRSPRRGHDRRVSRVLCSGARLPGEQRRLGEVMAP